ncbi:expressed protein [Chlorella variabilis]|uniref:Expressed protein n=1 Tax=Chlorella variabilis TaxID=554065 RepID=E1Z4A1_CHLVA|nr:expressed protein [Chlorella variabilis]EFN59316.1 expressed protein [Chlorella variabilis]|eukprot:XP_005851418.1 expressed protein [Chlorella variabilis]
MLCVRTLTSVSAVRPSWRRASSSRPRGASVISARAWNSWDQPQLEPPERFQSLFAVSHLPPSDNPLTVYDARDAIEACTGLWGEERQECLSVFGVDAGRVDTFYSTVFSLEMALSQDTDPEEEASHGGLERC